MNPSFDTSDRACDNAEETAGEEKAENTREYKIVNANDFDGAYHVEQDDEMEDESIISKPQPH